MKFIDITQYPFVPGKLTTYIPKIRFSGSEKIQDYEPQNEIWLNDERPVSINESYYLTTNLNKYREFSSAQTLQSETSESSSEKIHQETIAPNQESWLGVSIDFDTPLSGKILMHTLLNWIARHEILRNRICNFTSNPVRKILPSNLVDIEKVTLNQYESAEELSTQVKKLCEENTNPYKWPAYFFFTIARETGFSLFFVADHSLIDGYSLLTSADELKLLYLPKMQKKLSKSANSYLDYCAEKNDADITKNQKALEIWQSFLDSNSGKLPRFAIGQDIKAPSLDNGKLLQQTLNEDLLNSASVKKLERICRTKKGGAVFAGILAALAQTNMKLKNDNEFQAVLTRHTRSDSRWLKTLGWFVALCPFRIKIDEHNNFSKALELSIEELNRSKEGAKLPFGQISKILEINDSPSFVVSYMDTRLFLDPDLNSTETAIAIRSVNYSTTDTYLWFVRTHNGLNVSSRFPGFREATTNMQLFFSTLKSLLSSIIEN